MMMMHGVDCDFDKVTGTYPKGKDGRDISPKEYLKLSGIICAYGKLLGGEEC
jgi:hypothetical protein